MTYFLKQKSDALTAFKQYCAYIWMQRHKEIKALQVDNTKEYTEGNFRQYLRQEGIHLKPTAPYSPAQNGVAEHANCTLKEHTTSMLEQAGLSDSFRGEALGAYVHVRNMIPTAANPKTVRGSCWNAMNNSNKLSDMNPDFSWSQW